MIKQVAFLKAKQGLSYDAFVKRYEEVHAPLVIKVLPQIARYHRNFVIPGSTIGVVPGSLGAGTAPFFDVITEVWCESRAKFDELSDALTKTNAGAIIAEDDAQLIDRSQMLVFTGVEHSETVKLRSRPAGHTGGPAVKVIAIMRRKAGMSHEAFIDYYENQHSKLALKLLVKDGEPVQAEYIRTYPTTDGQRAPGQAKALGAEIDFDVMTKINFWTKADHEEYMRLATDPKIAAELHDDHEKFLDPDSLRILMIDERITPEADFRAQAKSRGGA